MWADDWYYFKKMDGTVTMLSERSYIKGNYIKFNNIDISNTDKNMSG